MKRWTVKEIIKGKFLWVLLLTILLTYLSTKLINRLFTREVTLDNGFIHTTHFHLNLPAILILMIPVGFISVFLLQLFFNKFSRQAGPSESHNAFTWYSMYGIVIGFLAFSGLTRLAFTKIMTQEIETTVQGLLWVGFVLILPAAVSITLTMLLNWGMIRLTKTNRRILAEIEQHQHEHRFKTPELKEKVIKALRLGRASTISGAIIYVRIVSFIIGTVKLTVAGFVALIAMLASAFSPGNHSGGGSSYTGPGRSVSQGDINAQKAEEKRQAQYQARQDQKQANYSARRFADQFNYNARYSKNEWNRYVHDQRKANESRKRANRM